eukprot:TCONS_00063339-protein
MPTIAKQLFNIPVQYIGMFFNLESITFGLTLYVINKLKQDDSDVYIIVIGISFTIMALQLISISALVHTFRILGISFLALFTVFTGIGWSAEQVFLVALLGKMVPDEVQGYASGVRRTAVNFSYICGATMTPFLNDYISEHIIVISIWFFVLITIFLYHRKRFIVS